METIATTRSAASFVDTNVEYRRVESGECEDKVKNRQAMLHMRVNAPRPRRRFAPSATSEARQHSPITPHICWHRRLPGSPVIRITYNPAWIITMDQMRVTE